MVQHRKMLLFAPGTGERPLLLLAVLFGVMYVETTFLLQKHLLAIMLHLSHLSFYMSVSLNIELLYIEDT